MSLSITMKIKWVYDDFGVRLTSEVSLLLVSVHGEKQTCRKLELRWAIPITDILQSSHFQLLKLASFRKRRASLSAWPFLFMLVTIFEVKLRLSTFVGVLSYTRPCFRGSRQRRLSAVSTEE